MQRDLNCAHPGCRWDYAQPLNKDLGTADNKLDECVLCAVTLIPLT